MDFILHTTLYSLINYICIVGTYSNGQVIHQILSISLFQCSLMNLGISKIQGEAIVCTPAQESSNI